MNDSHILWLLNTDSIQASPVSCFKDNSRVIPFSKYSSQSHTHWLCACPVVIIIYQSRVMLKRKVVSILLLRFTVYFPLFLFSVRSVSVWSWIRMIRSVSRTTNRSRSSASSWTLQKSWSQSKGAENIPSLSRLFAATFIIYNNVYNQLCSLIFLWKLIYFLGSFDEYKVKKEQHLF